MTAAQVIVLAVCLAAVLVIVLGAHWPKPPAPGRHRNRNRHSRIDAVIPWADLAPHTVAAAVDDIDAQLASIAETMPDLAAAFAAITAEANGQEQQT